jgi:hypothetical protein
VKINHDPFGIMRIFIAHRRLDIGEGRRVHSRLSPSRIHVLHRCNRKGLHPIHDMKTS